MTARANPVSEKKEKGLVRVFQVQTLPQHGVIHGSGRRRTGRRERDVKGWQCLTALSPSNLLSALDMHHRHPEEAVTFEFSILTMRTERAVIWRLPVKRTAVESLRWRWRWYLPGGR